MVLYSSQQARHSLFHTVRFRAISQIATMLSYIVLVRGMKEQAFGIYNLFYSFIPLVTTIASFGLEQTLRRFQPEYLRTGQSLASAWLVKTVAGARLAATVAVVIGVLLAWNFVAPRFHMSAYRAEFVVFGVLAVLYLQSMILQLSLASHMMHRFSVGSVAVIAVVKLLAYLGLSSVASLTLRNALVADIVAYAIGCLVLFGASRRTQAGGLRGGFHVEPTERKRLVRYALFNHLNDASSFLVYGQTDNFFIGALMSPVAVATYSFYGKLTEMINNLVPQRLFDNVIQPLFYSVPRADADSRLPRYFTLLVDLNIAFQLPIIALVAAYHQEIVQLFFGGKYLAYSSLFPLVLALSLIPSCLAVPISLVAQFHERTGVMLASELFGLYQVAAMLVLVHFFGLYGAALSTGTFHALRNFWIWWRLRDRVRWLNVKGVVSAAVLVWGSVIVACLIAQRLLVHFPALTRLAMGAMLCGAGMLAYLRSSGISTADRGILATIMQGREARALRWLGLVSRERLVAQSP
jgi:O-antigen/teichoic acid export membrane protein